MPVRLRVFLGALFVGVLVATVVIHLNASHAGAGGDLWARLLIRVAEIQRALHQQLTAAMHAVAERQGAATWSLITLSFLYGIFHAAGPGHGKIVISTYLLTQESEFRRGVLLSMVASLVQGLTAIVLVYATVSLLDFSLRRAETTAITFEAISYGLISIVGLMLVVSRLRRIFRRKGGGHAHHGHHHHHQDHGHGHSHPDHDDCAHCGHSHGPTRSDLAQPLSLRTFFALVLSVGIRPCSGAILVLLAAHAMNLPLAGIWAVLAMSLGTGLTVFALAALSVYARQMILGVMGNLPVQSTGIANILDAIAVFGGVVILAAGLALLQSALMLQQHPLL
ncbi:MAG: nickel/cobalt transporter [Rhodospirillaceae bacterium]|nr:nickel/cobalt transporter [Rhodospirillaceae bacterium]